MFVFNLTYVKPLSEVERVLPEHVAYLDRYYGLGKFVCSGRKHPRTDGVILCAAAEDRKSTRLNSSHCCQSRMPSSA